MTSAHGHYMRKWRTTEAGQRAERNRARRTAAERKALKILSWRYRADYQAILEKELAKVEFE